jgi:hypothetical protein
MDARKGRKTSVAHAPTILQCTFALVRLPPRHFSQLWAMKVGTAPAPCPRTGCASHVDTTNSATWTAVTNVTCARGLESTKSAPVSLCTRGVPAAAVLALFVSHSWDLLIPQGPLADGGPVHQLLQAMDLIRSTPGFGADLDVGDNGFLPFDCSSIVSEFAMATEGLYFEPSESAMAVDTPESAILALTSNAPSPTGCPPLCPLSPAEMLVSAPAAAPLKGTQILPALPADAPQWVFALSQ